VIVNSECTKRDLGAHTGIDPARVFVTYWAASPRVFHPVTDAAALRAVRQKYGIPERPYVVSLSTLEPRKNLVHLIRGFDELLSRYPDLDVSLVLAGAPGWLYEPILAAVEGAKHRERIVLAGRVADEDLAALLGGARCFVCVSHYEGFGLPALEAMQCRVPVIVSDNSALPEVVGDAGIQVPATEAAPLIEALRGLLTSDAQREHLARAGLERSKRFSWQSAARQTVEAYYSALEALERRSVARRTGAGS
jgi:glycosyltransferase involved in cell wall biosynthesis